MQKELKKTRIRGSQVRVHNEDPNDSQGKKKNMTLRIKHLEPPCHFIESDPLYDLIIADYDEKDFEIIKYINRRGESVFFDRKPIPGRAFRDDYKTVVNGIGLISRKAVDLLFLTNV